MYELDGKANETRDLLKPIELFIRPKEPKTRKDWDLERLRVVNYANISLV